MSTAATLFENSWKDQRWVWPAVLSGLVVLVYFHVITALVVNWWTDPDYGHGFFVVLFSAYLLWRRRERLKTMEAKPSNWGLLVMLLAVLFLFIGSLGAELFSSRVSLLVLLAGMVLFLAGWSVLRVIFFPLAFLTFMIPIPVIIYNQITFPLQLLASRLATSWLELLQVPVLRDGNILSMSNYSLEVVEACSGIRSLLTLVSLAVAYGYLVEPRRWVRYSLVVLMVPIAIVTNAIRIVVAGVLARQFGPAMAEGFLHEFSGWVIFICPRSDVSLPLGFATYSGEPFKRLLMRNQLGSVRLWITAGILIGAWLLLDTASHGEPIIPREPLSELPYTIGSWRGNEQPLDKETVQAVGVTDYTNRLYFEAGDAPLSLYVGYYASQRTGDTMHSPKNCLPGSGGIPFGQDTLRSPSKAGARLS